MLKIEFTNDELDYIKSKIHFTPLQERIIEYRLNEYSITKMSMLEHCSESTISREIKTIKEEANSPEEQEIVRRHFMKISEM